MISSQHVTIPQTMQMASYIAGMRDNVGTDAIRLCIVDTVRIELKPRSDFEDECGFWNRGEFDCDLLYGNPAGRDRAEMNK